jgi:REJ domain
MKFEGRAPQNFIEWDGSIIGGSALEISGPNSAPTCGTVTLSALGSVGSDLLWGVTPPLMLPSTNGRELSFAPGTLAAGDYTFTLHSRSRFNFVAVTSHNLSISAVPQLQVSVSPISVTWWSAWKLQPQFVVPPCFALSTAAVTFQWSYPSQPSALAGVDVNQPMLVLPPRTMSAVGWKSVFTFRLTVTTQRPAQGPVQIVTDADVHVLRSPPAVRIVGGDRTVGAGETLNLACVATDREGLPATFSYKWTCSATLGNGDCGAFFTPSQTNVLSIAANLPGEYEFACTASHLTGASSATTVSMVSVVAGNPPKISIAKVWPGPVVWRNEVVHIVARTGASSYWTPVSMTWEPIGSDFPLDATTLLTAGKSDFSCRNGTCASELIIRKGVLTSGKQYVFRCVGKFSSVGGEQEVFAPITVRARAGPTGGSLSLSPANGTAQQTWFVAKVPDWIGDGGGQLSYAFFLCRRAKCVAIRDMASAPIVKFVVPWALNQTEALELRTQVRDIWGTTVERSVQFFATPGATNSTFASLVAGVWANYRLSDYSTALRNLFMAVQLIGGDTRRQTAAQSQQASASTAVSAGASSSGGTAGRASSTDQQIAQTTAAVAQSAFPLSVEAQLATLDTLDTLMQSASFDAVGNAEDILVSLNQVAQSYAFAGVRNDSIPVRIEELLSRFGILQLDAVRACGQTGVDTKASVIRTASQSLRLSRLDERTVGVVSSAAVFSNTTDQLVNATSVPACLLASVWQFTQIDILDGSAADVSMLSAFAETTAAPVEHFAGPGVNLVLATTKTPVNATCARRSSVLDPWVQAHWRSANFTCRISASKDGSQALVVDRAGQYSLQEYQADTEQSSSTPTSTGPAISTGPGASTGSQGTTGASVSSAGAGGDASTATYVIIAIVAAVVILVLVAFFVHYRMRSDDAHHHQRVRPGHAEHDGSCTSEFETYSCSSAPNSSSDDTQSDSTAEAQVGGFAGGYDKAPFSKSSSSDSDDGVCKYPWQCIDPKG